MSIHTDPSVQTDSLPVVEEEAHVSTRSVQGDTVTVRRAVEHRSSSTDVDLSNWNVVVTRHPVGRTVDAAPAVRTEGDLTIIPVLEEVVETRTVLRLVEEVHVRRVHTAHTETVEVETRHHDVHIERDAPNGRTPQPQTEIP